MLSTSRVVENAELHLQQLRQEHQGHEQRLAELRQKLRLRPEEEVEMKELKKLKLHLKDRMAALERSRS